jgi:hypothetical protein
MLPRVSKSCLNEKASPMLDHQALLDPPKFLVTGLAPWGSKAVALTGNRQTAETLAVAWGESGFSDVRIADPKLAQASPSRP